MSELNFPGERSRALPYFYDGEQFPPLDIVRSTGEDDQPSTGRYIPPIVAGPDRGREATEAANTAKEIAPTRHQPQSEVAEDSPERNALIGEAVAATPGAAVSDPDIELRRTQMSVDCAEDAYRGDMRKFAHLTPEQQVALHEEVKALGDEEALRVFKYGLWTHDIGKNEDVRRAVEAGQTMDHDQVYTRLVSDPRYTDKRQKYMPGFDDLPQWGQERLIAMAQVESNYAQTLQGEAPAATLQDIHDVSDPEVTKWRILEAKFDIFGAAGHVNDEISLTATPATCRRMQNLDAALTDPTLATAQARNDAFLDKEVSDLKGPIEDATPEARTELRTLARLACHLRVNSRGEFAAMEADYNAQVPTVKEVLLTELNRETRPTLAYYSPELVRTLAEKEDSKYALEYFAHVLQEAHIVDSQARKEGLPGIATVQLDGLIRGIKQDDIDTRKQTIRFESQEGAIVAVPQQPTLEHLEGVPEFADGTALTGKRILLVGEGGGSDGVQAAMLGKLLSGAYGCEVAGVASVRSEEEDRSLANAGMQIGTATHEVTSETTAIGDWRFLEHIPTEGDQPTRMFILNSSTQHVIADEIKQLAEATRASVVIGVDTGGDSLYRTEHPGFSARNPSDITPDNDYNAIQGLAQYAAQQPDTPVLSVIIAPGVDSPPYAREVIDEIGAGRMPLSEDQVAQIRATYAEWGMDGSRSEEGRYGKTPLAWLHALQGNTGTQHLKLPRKNITSETNPWRAFTSITPAMREILFADMKRHAEAISRTTPESANPAEDA